jgi:protoporphyrinogen/coproporphyrinogen III oxidase
MGTGRNSQGSVKICGVVEIKERDGLRVNSVAIIGAGITGLTTAFRLQQENIPVTVYEAAPRVGGPMQTVRRDGYLAECGPNSILETSPVISALVRDVGLESRRVYASPEAKNRYIVRRGRPLPVPASPGRFLSTPLFSLGAKLRLAAEPFISRSEVDDEPLAEFVRRRLGQEFLDYAINPFVGGIYAGDPENLSVQHAFPKLAAVEERYGSLILGQFLGARERKRRGEVSKQTAPMFSFTDGLEALPRAIAEKLNGNLRLGSPVKAVRKTDLGWELVTERGCDEHSAVLLAIGAHPLARLRVERENFPDLSALAEVQYPPVASITLGFRRLDVRAPLDGFGVLVPEVEGRNILGALFTSSIFPNRAPDRHVTITSYIGGARAPHLALHNQAGVIEMVLRDLRDLLEIDGAPTFQHCHFFPEAIPQYNVGYGRFKELMAEAEAAGPGLFIAGQARCGISLSDSILSGHKAAERVENHLARVDHRLGAHRLATFNPS